MKKGDIVKVNKDLYVVLSVKGRGDSKILKCIRDYETGGEPLSSLKPTIELSSEKVKKSKGTYEKERNKQIARWSKGYSHYMKNIKDKSINMSEFVEGLVENFGHPWTSENWIPEISLMLRGILNDQRDKDDIITAWLKNRPFYLQNGKDNDEIDSKILDQENFYRAIEILVKDVDGSEEDLKDPIALPTILRNYGDHKRRQIEYVEPKYRHDVGRSFEKEEAGKK